ncbi:MAG: Eco57I restriction-modification methylase domain-containing protein, partial [Pseudomonadota bacterium]|nr:Eco57I restriction-modification methylase domain-containing protein [Pseudomonadota bacterium]
LQDLGALLLQTEFDRLALAAKNIAQVADLTDVDIAEAQLSKKLAQEAAAQVAPIHAVLDFWRALRWLVPGWPVDKISKLSKILKSEKDKPSPVLEGLVKLLNPDNNLAAVLASGRLDGKDAATLAANDLMAKARALAKRETFFHWWTSFPTVFGTGGRGGFDAVIGNPPWDRIKLQEVEWFAERSPAIAAQPRAADRKRMIAALANVNMTQTATNTPPVVDLWAQYQDAVAGAEANARVLGNGKLGSGDYPLLGGGDLNLYSLFVERAQALVAPDGLVALLTPSGIAADKGAAEFFGSISNTGRLGALFDFENRKVFFPDVHASFKFCALVFGGLQRNFAETRCAFYLHQLAELDDPARSLVLTASDFKAVNPNTGAAPIFRSRRDANITLRLYATHPVLVKRGEVSASTGVKPDEKAWRVKYLRMFDMTNDSKLFMKSGELMDKGWQPAGLNRWKNTDGAEALPLYVGRMIHHFDHRAANVTTNEESTFHATLSDGLVSKDKENSNCFPLPQYWVLATSIPSNDRRKYYFGFRSIARATDARTLICSLIPESGTGNSLPVLLAENGQSRSLCLFQANMSSFALDYVLRQKIQTSNVNWYILEQLPVIAPARFNEPLPATFTQAMRAAGLMNGHHPQPTVADFVIPQVLALTYTAHDMAPFARDLGYVDAAGEVLPPFVWNDEERRTRLAALDALFFYLYGLNADDAAYILDTFPIVREQDTKAFGCYRTKDDVLQYLSFFDQGSDTP